MCPEGWPSMLECMGSPAVVVVAKTLLQPRSWLESGAEVGGGSGTRVDMLMHCSPSRHAPCPRRRCVGWRSRRGGPAAAASRWVTRTACRVRVPKKSSERRSLDPRCGVERVSSRRRYLDLEHAEVLLCEVALEVGVGHDHQAIESHRGGGSGGRRTGEVRCTGWSRWGTEVEVASVLE
jgi:hypothetical protein